jgi:site-specific DNA recombinase
MKSAAGTGIYCRLSLARMGDTTKVEDQERICRDLAESRGWAVTHVWRDNNVSAWRHDRKRPGWDAMLKAIEAGQLGCLIIYHGDRLIRHPWDLEILFKIADAKGIRLASPTGTRNLDNAEDRTMLRVEAAFACRESDNISRRKKAGFERMALEGRSPAPGGIGGRAFGYEKDGRTPIPAEAAALTEAASRIIAGETRAAICRDLTAHGLTSTTGQPMTYATLKRILLRPRTAGLMASRKPGTWEALITPEQQKDVRKAIAGRGPATGPTTATGNRYLLSGIALCWACHKPVQVANAGPAGRGVKGYACVVPGCRKARRNVAHLDAYVTGAVCGLLAEVDFGPAIELTRAAGESLAREIAFWEERLAETQETMGELANQPGLTAAMLLRSVREIEAKLAGLRAREMTPRRRLLHAHKGITPAQFMDLPLHVRRQLVAGACTVTILRASHKGPGFNPADVQIAERRAED